MDQIIFTEFENFYNRFSSWLGKHLLPILLILLIAWAIKKFGVRIIMQLLQKTIRPDLYPTKSDRTKRLKTLESLIGAVLKVAVFIVATIMIVTELGVNTTPLLASAGILGVALGFGAQSLIKDLTSGIFIITENQYRVGDVVEINGNIKGKVEGITIRTTLVRSLSGKLYHIPNGSIGWTANKTMQYGGIAEDITFDRNVDIEKLELIINRTGKKLLENDKLAKKIKTPPEFNSISGFDNNGIKVKILGTTTSDDAFVVKSEFYRLLIKELRKANIEIPYQQLTVTTKPTKKPSSSS